MSDYIVKFIPTQPHRTCTEHQAHNAVAFLKSAMPAEDVRVELRTMPEFVDCGSNLESICCPICGTSLDFDWWNEAMDRAWKTQFSNLQVVLPCCGSHSSLNDLTYHFPCGFACAEVQVWNPAVSPGQSVCAQVEQLLETPVRVIHCHF